MSTSIPLRKIFLRRSQISCSEPSRRKKNRIKKTRKMICFKFNPKRRGRLLLRVLGAKELASRMIRKWRKRKR